MTLAYINRYIENNREASVEVYLNVSDPTACKPCLVTYRIDLLNTTVADSLPPIPKHVRFMRTNKGTFEATVDPHTGGVSHESAITGTGLGKYESIRDRVLACEVIARAVVGRLESMILSKEQ